MLRFHKFLCVLGIFLVAWPLLVLSQETQVEDAIEDTIDYHLDLFASDEPLEITLTFDRKKYQRTKSEGEYMPAELSYRINDSLTIDRIIRIKARGELRKGYCHYAPFWLNIRKSDLKVDEEKEIKRMKVVTQCMKPGTFANYVLREYLIYRMYEMLSPASFRTRLVRMKYVDTGRKNKETETWAFIIEPEEMVAERLNARFIENAGRGMSMMEHEAMTLVSIFQYMIGNPDYSVSQSHNVKFLGLPGYKTEGYTPVPYDFDFAGLVNASYAAPAEILGISSVTERIFLGPCRTNEEYRETLDYILEFRNEITQQVSSFPYLEDRLKKESLYYLESFFQKAEKPGLEYNFNNSCR